MPNGGVASRRGYNRTCSKFFSSPDAPCHTLAPHRTFALGYAFAACPLACACRPPSYVERIFLEPEPFTRLREGVWLDALWPQFGTGLNGLFSE